MEKNKLAQTNYGISLLRILATFLVIIIHVSGPQVVKFGKISNIDWHIANFYDSISRFSVPVFFMISGALLLGRATEITEFLKNRLWKIIPPFLFWSFFYSLSSRYIFSNEEFNILKIIRDVFYGSEYHLWFILTLIGVYLVTPIFQKWILNSKKSDILYFLIIWAVTLILNIPKISIYFPKINLTYFSGFLGYFILGYYLNNYIKLSSKISYLMIIIGVFITFYGTYYFSFKNNKFYETLYEYLNINSMLVSIGVFSLFMTIENINEKFKPLIFKLNECSFGIFLIHPFILNIFIILGVFKYSFNPFIDIFIHSLFCFILSFIVIYIVRKIKYGHLIA